MSFDPEELKRADQIPMDDMEDVVASNTALDEFGRFMMVHLRDRAIGFYDKLVRSEWRAPSLRKLQSDLYTMKASDREIARRCVVRAIDSAIHDFLCQLQEATDSFDAPLIEVRVQGKNVAELSDGLQGEPYTEDGWQAKFSASGEAAENA